MLISCSWCHEFNDTNNVYCKECGHEVNKARIDCECPQCDINYKKAKAEGK